VGAKTPINNGLLSLNFIRKSKNMPNPRRPSNSIFCRLLKQFGPSRSKRGGRKEGSHPILKDGTPSEAAHVNTRSQPSRLAIARPRCCPLLTKVSIIEFPSSLWSCRSKPHRKPTTIARENWNSGEPPRSTIALPAWLRRCTISEKPESSLASPTTVIRLSDTPLTSLNLNRRSKNRRLLFYGGLWTHESAAWTQSTVRGHIPWNFQLKNNSFKSDDSHATLFLQKHPPKFFEIIF
jgi:hypothetical protein